MSKDTHNISRRCCSVNVHDVTQEGYIFSLCRHYLNPKKQCWYSPSQKSLEQSHFPSFLLLSLFLLSCAVPCMPFHKPARWVFPVSAGLLLYVALFDWFDDLWPDCPSGHSRVHLAVYCIFFFFFCCDWISTASLSIWLANDSALSVKRMKRENDLLLPVPPCALPVFSLQSSVGMHLCLRGSAFSWTCRYCHSRHPSLPCVQCSAFHFVLGRHWAQLDSETQEIWHHLLPAMF